MVTFATVPSNSIPTGSLSENFQPLAVAVPVFLIVMVYSSFPSTIGSAEAVLVTSIFSSSFFCFTVWVLVALSLLIVIWFVISWVSF